MLVLTVCPIFSKRDIIVASFLLHEVHCKRNLKLCDMCGNPVPKSEIEQHYLEEHAPEPCDLCGEKLPKDGLDAHKVSLTSL